MANDKPKKSTFRKVVDYARANPGEAAATALMVVPIGGWAVGGAIRGGLAARKAYKARKFIGAKIKKKAVAAGKKVAKYTQKLDQHTSKLVKNLQPEDLLKKLEKWANKLLLDIKPCD